MLCFQDSGKIPLTIDKSIIHLRQKMANPKNSFRSDSEMLSEPQEKVFFTCLTTDIIVSLSVSLLRWKHVTELVVRIDIIGC